MTAMATSGDSSVPERPMIGIIKENIPKKTSIVTTAGMALLARETTR